MYDTVRFSHDARRLEADTLHRRGWTVTTTRRPEPDGTVTDNAYLNPGDKALPRLNWYGDSGIVTAECSLPKLLNGDNVTLLYEADLPAAFKRASEYVSEVLGLAADVAEWNVARVDYCFCWQVGDERLPLYLEALARLHLSGRHDRQAVNDESVTWHSRSTKLYFYNKHAESKLDAARGVLRLEAAIKDVHYLSGDKHKLRKQLALNGSRRAADVLTDDKAKLVLEYFLERLGLAKDRPIMSKAGLLGRMVKEFGVAGAGRLYLFAQLYELHGPKLADAIYSRRTFQRHRKQLAESGLLTWHDKDDIILPALKIEDTSER